MINTDNTDALSKTWRVLVVNDAPMVYEQLRETLKRLSRSNIQLCSASTSQEALRLIRSELNNGIIFNAIITGGRLQDYDNNGKNSGEEFVRKVRTECGKIYASQEKVSIIMATIHCERVLKCGEYLNSFIMRPLGNIDRLYQLLCRELGLGTLTHLKLGPNQTVYLSAEGMSLGILTEASAGGFTIISYRKRCTVKRTGGEDGSTRFTFHFDSP